MVEAQSLVGRRFSYRPDQGSAWIAGYKIKSVSQTSSYLALEIRDAQTRKRVFIPLSVFRQIERGGQITWESRDKRPAHTRPTDIEQPEPPEQDLPEIAKDCTHGSRTPVPLPFGWF